VTGDRVLRARPGHRVTVGRVLCAVTWLGLPLLAPLTESISAGRALAQEGAELQRLQRSWKQLDAELKTLDRLLPDDPQRDPAPTLEALPLPPALLRANQAPQRTLTPAEAAPAPPLQLPAPAQLKDQGVQGLGLQQALAIAFAGSATLQTQREQVAASLASLQAALGAWWPTVSAVASGSSGQSGT